MSYRNERKQDFNEGEMCPVCFDLMEEGHQHEENHKLYAFINFLIVEYLFDYNDGAWMQMNDEERQDVIFLMMRTKIFMSDYDLDLSMYEVINKLQDSGVFADLLNELMNIFDRYPDIAERITEEKIMQLCWCMYRLQI